VPPDGESLFGAPSGLVSSFLLKGLIVQSTETVEIPWISGAEGRVNTCQTKKKQQLAHFLHNREHVTFRIVKLNKTGVYWLWLWWVQKVNCESRVRVDKWLGLVVVLNA
jgi:hypothetical protein